ncbi:MAG: pleckstriny domain-containing expressed, partial [Trebouxia sp. A1-2]
GPRWLEADVDMDSSGVANHVVALVKGVTTSQTIDMAVVLQGSRPDLLPERLLGSVRFSRLDLKTAIPLNPNDYPDDLLDPSPPPSPHPHMSGLSNNSIEHSQSLQSTYSLRSASGSGSTTALDNGHLDGLRQASGSNKGQPDGPSMPQTRLSASSDRNMAGPNHPGPLSFAPATSERPWPAQQLHTNTFGHNLPGLSTVPEAQQQPPAPPAQQQAILRASSLQPQRSLQQSGVSTIKHRMTRAQSGQDPNIPTERAKWSDRPVMSGHF